MNDAATQLQNQTKPLSPSVGSTHGVASSRPKATWLFFPPEARFVFLLAGADSEGGIERLAAASSDVREWGLVIAFAQREGAIVRLAHVLRHNAIRDAFRARSGQEDELFTQMSTYVQRLAQLSGFRSAALERQLAQLVAALCHEEIPVMLLKGAALATSMYPRFADRPMGDLDLLVRPSDATRAMACATRSGWESAVGPDFAAFYAAHHHLPPLIKKDGVSVRLDVHTSLVPPDAAPHLPAEAFWQSARPSTVPGALRPDHSQLLVHACIHFAWSHAMSVGGWKCFEDIARLLAHPEFDRARFLSGIHSARAERSAGWTMFLSSSLGGVAGAEELAHHFLGPGRSPRQRVLERHFAVQLCGGTPPDFYARVSHRFWEAAMLPGQLRRTEASRPWSRDAMYDEAFDSEHANDAPPANPPVEAGPITRSLHFVRYAVQLLRAL